MENEQNDIDGFASLRGNIRFRRSLREQKTCSITCSRGHQCRPVANKMASTLVDSRAKAGKQGEEITRHTIVI